MAEIGLYIAIIGDQFNFLSVISFSGRGQKVSVRQNTVFTSTSLIQGFPPTSASA